MAEAGNEKRALLVYHDWRGPLETLSDADRGKLILALLDYSENGTVPDFDGTLATAFAFMKPGIDRDAEAWKSKRERRAEAGRRGGVQKRENQLAKPSIATNDVAKPSIATNARKNVANLASNININSNSNIPITTPINKRETEAAQPPEAEAPSLKDVEDYVRANGFSMNPSAFFDYYSARAWRINGEPVMDWKALCRSWQSRERKKPAEEKRPYGSAGQTPATDTAALSQTLAQLERLRAKMNQEAESG